MTEIIRKLRNRCAHEGTRIELDAETVRSALEQFRVAHRRYYDWGKVRAASTARGLVLYTGDRPSNAITDLTIPGTPTFNKAIWTILHVLAANLEVPFAKDEVSTEAIILELPEFMRLSR